MSLCHSDTGRQSKMCGSVSSSWLLKILRCVSVDGIHIQETTEPIPQQGQGSSRRHPSADLLNLPGPVATHGSGILGFFFFFFKHQCCLFSTKYFLSLLSSKLFPQIDLRKEHFEGGTTSLLLSF